MTATDTEVPGTAEELHDDDTPMPEHGAELAVRQATGKLMVAPAAEAGELVARLDVIKAAMDTAMVKDIDYGVIPGTQKPTLLKPGSEKLGVLFQLDVQVVNDKTFGPGQHLTVESKAVVYHAPTGARIGSGEGMCTTHEKKYGKRNQSRLCPACGVAAIIKGKQEYGGGWVCFKKKDGCGAKYDDNDPAITEQIVGEVENPDIADTWNTVVKMAAKRARIDAILATTGASALFTQDVEDTTAAADVAAVPTELAVAMQIADEALVAKVQRSLLWLVGTGHGDEINALLTSLQTEAKTDGVPRLSARAVALTVGLVKTIRDAAGPPTPAETEGVQDQPPDPPAAGTLDPPALTGQPAKDIENLRAAGCNCDSPLEAGVKGAPMGAASDTCPIKTHGIPF